MKSKLINSLFTGCALLLFSAKANAQTVTIEVNSTPTSNITLDACDPLPSVEATTSAINAAYYEWKWYKDDVLIWSDTEHHSSSSTLGDHYSGQGVYKAQVRINLTTTVSTTTTISLINYGQYNGSASVNRMVSGDFDNDGFDDDVVDMYYYGSLSTTLHVWKSNGSALVHQGDNGWWHSPTYDATKIVGMVTFDFDNDGFRDDIAAFYNYGGTTTEMHVFTSNGSSFSFASRWSSTGFNASVINSKVVAGDFDRDGFYDDVAAFYAYDATNTSIFLWKSTGTAISPMATWYSNATYNGNSVTGKVVSGDFNKDGYEDDIAAFYSYSALNTTLNVFKPNATSNPTAFTLVTTSAWSSTAAAGASMAGTVVSGDFDHDSYRNDIGVVYYDNPNATRIIVWKGNGATFAYQGDWWSSLTYDQTKVKGRVVSGNFNNNNFSSDKRDDIVAFYDYGYYSAAAHLFYSNSNGSGSTAFNYPGDAGIWHVCSGVNPLIVANGNTDSENGYIPEIAAVEDIEGMSYTVFPNPSTGKFTITQLYENAAVEIYNLAGEKVFSDQLTGREGSQTIDVQQLRKGVYFLNISNTQGSRKTKIIIE